MSGKNSVAIDDENWIEKKVNSSEKFCNWPSEEKARYKRQQHRKWN